MYYSRRTKLTNLKFMNPTTNFVKTSLLSECVVLHDAVTFIKSSLNVEGISQGIGADPFCKLSSVFGYQKWKGENRGDKKQNMRVKPSHLYWKETHIISKHIQYVEETEEWKWEKIIEMSLFLHVKIKKKTFCVAIWWTECWTIKNKVYRCLLLLQGFDFIFII